MLKWTTEPPTKPGWYWIKLGEKGLTFVVEVYFYPYSVDKLVFNEVWGEGMTISVKNAKKFYRPLWAGPIPEPQIMPAPEPEQCPFKEWDLVLCRDHEEQKWQVHRFIRYVDYDITCKFMTTTSRPYNITNYRYCLPLAGNEHLLDTADSPE